jgi:hypothetical protein
MYNSRYEEMGQAEIKNRINIFVYLRRFLDELWQLEGSKTKLTSEFDALRVKGLMNNPKNTTFKSLNDMRSGQPFWREQEVDYIVSNLGKGKGYIFYFICTRCDRRVKYLYEYSFFDPPLCRKCCQIPYRPKTYSERKLQKLNDQ